MSSAIITLQRLQPELVSLHWSKILLKNISEDIYSWRDVRDILIRTSLLSPIEIISMLGEQEQLWKGAELESDFQNAIGWQTRWTINQKEPALNDVNRSVLDLWIRKASSYPTRSNFILTWGLRFSTEAVRGPALRWIQMYPVMFQTHYLLVAWMECHLSLEDIALSFQQWIDKFKYEFHFSFVVEAWLDAGGAFSVVSSHAILWLHQNYDKEEAVYLTKFLAKQRDIPVETVKDILMWCNRFPNNGDALWRLTQLKLHLLNEEVGEEVITTSEAVLNPLILIQVPLTAVIRGQINTLFSYLISAPKLRSGQLRNRVDKLFLAWLRNPASFGSDRKPHINPQRLNYFQRFIDLIVSGALNITLDYEHIKRFLHWVNSWEQERKLQLYRKFAFLKQNYPAPDLWDIVKIR